MADQKVIAYYRCENPSEISIELQRKRVREYCSAMNYDLFVEITADNPCTEQEAEAICTVIRQEMRIPESLKIIVLNLHRLNHDIHTVHRVVDIFGCHDISVESTSKADHEILALTDQEEYDLFQALAGTGISAQ
jgi:hypothetical protein